MPSVVIEHQRGDGFAKDRKVSTGTRKFTVIGFSAVEGDDPRLLAAIPQPTDEYDFGGFTLRCDRARIEKVIKTGTNFIIACDYSNDGRFRFNVSQPDETVVDYNIWETSHSTEQVDLPRFVLNLVPYPKEDGTFESNEEWTKAHITIKVEFPIIYRTVVIEDLTNDEIKEVMRLAQRQSGKLHKLEGASGIYAAVWWLMLAPTFRGPREGVVQINYAWKADPGNGGLNIPNPPSGGGPAIQMILAPKRPGFYEYVVRKPTVVIEAGEITVYPPAIAVQDLFPPLLPDGSPNPYVEESGWVGLPGGPIR